MKRLGWLLCPVAAVVLVSGLALSADAKNKGAAAKKKAADGKKKGQAGAKKKSKVHKGGPAGEITLAVMTRELSLTAEQRGKIKPLWGQRDQALANWDGEIKGRKLKDLELDLKAAAGQDRGRVLAMIKPLRAKREVAAAAYDYKIRALLTTSRKTEWTAFLLARDLVRLFNERIDLTGSQADDIRQLCKKAAQRMPLAPDKTTMSMMRSRLAGEIFDRILTDAQRKTLNPGHKTAKKSSSKKKNNNRNRNNRNNRNRNNRNRNRNKNNNKQVAKSRSVPMPKSTVGSAMNMKPGGGAQNMKPGGGSSSGGKKAGKKK